MTSTSQFVEFLVYLGGSLLVCAYIIKVGRYKTEALHILLAKLIAEAKVEQSVGGVVLIQHRKTLFGGEHLHVLGEIHESGLYGI